MLDKLLTCAQSSQTPAGRSAAVEPESDYQRSITRVQGSLKRHGIMFISSRRGKFKPFEARRLLLKENALFLADERVVPLHPRLLIEMVRS